MRLIKFCFVGASGVFVDMTILFLLADKLVLGWPIIPSKIIATEIAIVNNFIWNDRWTFRDVSGPGGKLGPQFVRFGKFNLFCLIGMALNVVLLQVQVKYLGINLYCANLAAIAVVTLWNFTMNLKYAWSAERVKT